MRFCYNYIPKHLKKWIQFSGLALTNVLDHLLVFLGSILVFSESKFVSKLKPKSQDKLICYYIRTKKLRQKFRETKSKKWRQISD